MLSSLWSLAVSWNLNTERSLERRGEKDQKGSPPHTVKELAISGSPSLVGPTSAFPQIPNLGSQRPPTYWMNMPQVRALLWGTEFINSLHSQTVREQIEFIFSENRANTIMASDSLPHPCSFSGSVAGNQTPLTGLIVPGDP